MLNLSKLISLPTRLIATVQKQIPQLNYGQLEKLMKDNKKVLIIDVREAYELTKDGKIPESVHIPLGDVANYFKMDSNLFKDKTHIDKPDMQDSKLVLYCRRGIRAMKGAQCLQDMGFENLFTFPGGVVEWQQHNK